MKSQWNYIFSALLVACAALVFPEPANGLQTALPPLPQTPAMANDDYPDCRDDYQRRDHPNQVARATNRCVEELDEYNRDVLVTFRQAMIDHQSEIGRIYGEEVVENPAYSGAQKSDFFTRLTAEHEASNPDGAHFEEHRALETRYQEDRAFLQDIFCDYVQCEGRPAPAAAEAYYAANGGNAGGEAGEDQCGTERAGGGILGSIVGGLVGNATGVGAVGGLIAGQFAGVLVAEIACRLTREEQELAAEATEEVTQAEEIGATAAWISPTRADVSGTSTVTALLSQPNGDRCMDVVDVIIVEGEEIRASKRMCRADGESRYTLNA